MKTFITFICIIFSLLLNNDKHSQIRNSINTKKDCIMSNISNCEFKGIKLHGKVKFVDNFADIKIQYVDNFPDIKIKFVDNFPNECGEWQKVESFPDFTVEVVESFPDIKVKIVDNFPGVD